MPDLDLLRVVELRDRLGSDDDAEVLEAARALHQAAREAGLSWVELLMLLERLRDADRELLARIRALNQGVTKRVELLDRLGSEDNAGVVEAARTLHKEVTGPGLDWDVLLTPEEHEEPAFDDADEDEDEGEYEDEAEDEPEVDAEAFAGDVKDSRDAEVLALIERLLARRQLAEATREELAGYKEDIAEGELDEADRKYVRALHARISKRR
jgi:hypothetical protein